MLLRAPGHRSGQGVEMQDLSSNLSTQLDLEVTWGHVSAQDQAQLYLCIKRPEKLPRERRVHLVGVCTGSSSG